MKPGKLLSIVGVAALVAVLVSGQAALPALADHTTEHACEDAGGGWYGSDAENGTCLFPINHSISKLNCTVPDIYYFTYTAGSLTNSGCTPFTPEDGWDESTCFGMGGEFEDLGLDGTTCTVSHDLYGDCPSGQTTVYMYDGTTLEGFECQEGGEASDGGLEEEVAPTRLLPPDTANTAGRLRTPPRVAPTWGATRTARSITTSVPAPRAAYSPPTCQAERPPVYPLTPSPLYTSASPMAARARTLSVSTRPA